MLWALARDGGHTLFCAPGNAGTGQVAANLAINVNDHEGLLAAAEEHAIDMTVVGPEAPLASGLVDRFQAAGLTIFGPSKAAAKLESSKLFARDFMAEFGIPHPQYTACGSKEAVRKAVGKTGFPIVLKADGLAAGKGVIICLSGDDVDEALVQFFDTRAFGDAGLVLSVEQCLVGTEISVFALSDGERICVIGTAQDYKRAYDGNAGPNTGGMGSISPSPIMTPMLLEEIKTTILQPTVDGMQKRGTPYAGFLYAGLMMSDGKPHVIEYNVRLGDPETQVVLPLMATSFYELIDGAASGRLPDEAKAHAGAAVSVVLAAEGYPGSYEKGHPIAGLDRLDDDVLVFHAGTALDEDGRLVSNGGRVLNVAATGDTLSQAAKKVYGNIPRINFPGSFYRRDIGG